MDVPLPPYLAYLGSIGEKSQWAMEAAAVLVIEKCSPTPVAPSAFPWWTLRKTDVEKILHDLAPTKAPATVERCRVLIRQIAIRCQEASLLEESQLASILRVKLPRGTREPKGRYIPADELLAMARVCTADATGTRDRAILAVLAYGGMRRDEAVHLDMKDYDPKGRTLKILHGKGNKTRTLPVALPFKAELDAWIAFRGPEPGAILCRCTRRALVPGKAITGEAVFAVLMKLGKRAGLRMTPHDLRRTFASDALDCGDLSTTSKLMGHSSADTTRIYDRRGERAAQALVEKMPERF